jgi:hypothetical protein
MEKPNVKENFIKKKKTTTTTTIKCSRRGTKQFCEKKKKELHLLLNLGKTLELLHRKTNHQNSRTQIF